MMTESKVQFVFRQAAHRYILLRYASVATVSALFGLNLVGLLLYFSDKSVESLKIPFYELDGATYALTVLKVISPALLTLILSILGYYFGSRSQYNYEIPVDSNNFMRPYGALLSSFMQHFVIILGGTCLAYGLDKVWRLISFDAVPKLDASFYYLIIASIFAIILASIWSITEFVSFLIDDEDGRAGVVTNLVSVYHEKFGESDVVGVGWLWTQVLFILLRRLRYAFVSFFVMSKY